MSRLRTLGRSPVRLPVLALSWLASTSALAGTVTVDFLDIGQGDAILVRGSGKSVLIDAGDRGSDVVEQLQRLEVDRLDLVVATHPHADHIGDMADVLSAFDVGLYMDNGLPHTTATYEAVMQEVEARGVPYRTARAGLVLKLGDEAAFTVLHPQEEPLRGTRSDLNSNSVVLLLEHDEVSFLFTGDAEEPTEDLLVRHGLADVDVLKVAHHGSGHSSAARFLARVRPDHAVISCGEGNRYGHPDPEALDRLREAGAIVYRTDESGHLRAVSDGRSVEILEGSLDELGPRWPVRAPGSLAAADPDDDDDDDDDDFDDAPDEDTAHADDRGRKKRERRKKRSRSRVERQADRTGQEMR